jgi:TatD DNase family protein
MRLVDTHCHLYWPDFASDLEAVLGRAEQAGVALLVQSAPNPDTTQQAIEMARQYPDRLWAMAAIHPSEVKTATEADLERIATLARDPSVVAIGESGLDYYWDRSFEAKQQAFFREHIRLAIALDKPLIIHNREAHTDLLRILRQEARSGLRGILHCFSGDEAFAREAVRMGFLLGIGGVITYRKSTLPEVVRSVGLAHLVLETDAPFLAPVPHRGRRNEPAYLTYVRDRLAEILGCAPEEVAQRTTEAACRLFGLALPEVA